MATSSTTIPNPEHVGGHPPVIIVTDELEELEEEPPYDIKTSEVEDEASATRVSLNTIHLAGSYISDMVHSSR